LDLPENKNRSTEQRNNPPKIPTRKASQLTSRTRAQPTPERPDLRSRRRRDAGGSSGDTPPGGGLSWRCAAREGRKGNAGREISFPAGGWTDWRSGR